MIDVLLVLTVMAVGVALGLTSFSYVQKINDYFVKD
jgi:hypothetical protein